MNTKPIVITLIVTFVIVALMVFLTTVEKKGAVSEDDLASLATCLTDSGAKFYGAFWCGHCQSQKRAFGDAASLLPYIECSTEDGSGQLPICEAAGITSYPSWEFADGSLLLGEISLSQLAEKAECDFVVSNSQE